MRKVIYILIAVLIAASVFYNYSKVEKAADEQIKEEARPTAMRGYIVMGHEVRTFRPCGEGVPEYWVLGDSNAYEELKSVYEREIVEQGASPYTPLYVEIEGKIANAPLDGFGADYQEGIRIESLIKTMREGSCKNNLIKVSSPHAGETISSPIKITGEARGYWFFEGDFPIVLVDWDGLIIAEGYATASGEWMTEEFVPFEGELKFIKPEYDNRGTLILRKDNPSDLIELDDALEVPVSF